MSLITYKLSAAVPSRHQLLPPPSLALAPPIKIKQVFHPVLPL